MGWEGGLPSWDCTPAGTERVKPPTHTLSGWMELEGARRGLAQGAFCAPHSGLVVRTHSDRKESAFLPAFGDNTVPGGGCPGDQCAHQTHTPHLEKLPNHPGLQVFSLLFFHLLRFHEAWELWGNLRTPPPTSELLALPQDGAVVSIRPTLGVAHARGTSHASWSPLSRDIIGRLDLALGGAFPPASPSRLLPEEPA